MRRVRIPILLGLILFVTVPQTAFADNRAFATQIEDRAGGKFKRFYTARQFAPLWLTDSGASPAGNALIDLLETADLDGLKSASYRPEYLRVALANARTGDARARADAELKLSKAFARYVADMRRVGKSRMIYADAALKPGKRAPDAILAAAAMPRSLTDYVTTLGWMSPHYRQSRALLAKAEALGADEDTLRIIRANRDRARELPSAWTHHIVVDAASGRLWYYQAGRAEGTMRVVVGRPASPTPMLAGMLRYAILNPYWNVPVDLARKSVAPKVIGGKTLASMRMQALSDWTANAQPLDSAQINWPAVASGATELRVRQLPGGDNAMGRVKFMFPNDMGIYLHDTPDKALMKEDSRHFSNGCIRLEDAARLSKWLFGGQAMKTPKSPEQVAPLPHPVPVYLTYLTAGTGTDGVRLAEDVYGLDGRVN
jgi:L,D-transpeptidase YcbB